MNIATDSLRFRFERDGDALILEEIDAPPGAGGVYRSGGVRPGCRLANEEDARALADAIEDIVSGQENAWLNEGWDAALAFAEEDTDDEDE